MKKLIILNALILSNLIFAAMVNTVVPIDKVFSPFGFDTNDNVEVVLTGYLPNVCYRNPTTEVEIKDNTINIKVTARKLVSLNNFCAEMIIPFQKVIDLGVLDSGKYNIIVNKNTMYQKSEKISVAESTSNAIDDYVYANVEYIEKKMGSRTVHLKGYNPSDCFILKEIKVVDNGKDTFSILPKMTQVSSFCPMKMIPFDYEVQIPNTLKEPKVLLHVRILEGKSVNTLFPNNIQ